MVTYSDMPARRRILVADDNALMRKNLCKIFADHETLEVCEEAVNGKDAVEKARLCKPDLVILDLSMPVMNGMEAAKIIHSEMPGVPIILFTQHGAIVSDSGVHHIGIARVVSKDEMFKLPEHAVHALRGV